MNKNVINNTPTDGRMADKEDKSPFEAISSGGWYDDERDPHEISDELHKGRVNTRIIEGL